MKVESRKLSKLKISERGRDYGHWCLDLPACNSSIAFERLSFTIFCRASKVKRFDPKAFMAENFDLSADDSSAESSNMYTYRHQAF